MKKIIILLLAIFEFFFYNFVMVIASDIEIENKGLEFLLSMVLLLIISIVLYILMRVILRKLRMNVKRSLFIIPLCNLVIAFFLGIFLMLLSNEKVKLVGFLLLISIVYYGLFVNIGIVLFNLIFTKKSRDNNLDKIGS